MAFILLLAQVLVLSTNPTLRTPRKQVTTLLKQLSGNFRLHDDTTTMNPRKENSAGPAVENDIKPVHRPKGIILTLREL